MSKQKTKPYVESFSEGQYKLTFGQKFYLAIRAGLDFIFALLALILLSPLFIIVAIAIKVDSKGPVFFVQKRIGKNGKEFNCVKFRSMAQEANHSVAGYQYAEVDSYITKVGHFIRKFSIDELPQIFNILAFQMGWIGFRPSQSCETELNTAREGFGMYQIKPGISGWAQVNGRDVLAAHPTKKAQYDAYYLKNVNLWLDIKIFFMTIGKVFGVSDVEEGVLTTDEVVAEVNETAELLEVAVTDDTAVTAVTEVDDTAVTEVIIEKVEEEKEELV